MPHARTSSSKRKGGKIKREGGLGGPGGRGGRRWSLRPIKGRAAPALPDHVLDKSPRAMALEVKRVADRDTSSRATPYRVAMSAISAYANQHSKTMSPARRKQLALAKDELRSLYDMPQNSKGKGGPGRAYHKPKAKSRRQGVGAKQPAKPRE